MNPLLLVVALALSPHRSLVAFNPPLVAHMRAEITMLAWCDVWHQPTIMVTSEAETGIVVSWILIASGTLLSPSDGDVWSDVFLLEPGKSAAWMSPVSSLRLVISYLEGDARSSGQSIEVSCPRLR
jgi:hypothetical protein